MPGFPILPLPRIRSQPVLRSLTVVISKLQLSMRANVAGPSQANPSPSHLLYLGPVMKFNLVDTSPSPCDGDYYALAHKARALQGLLREGELRG